MALGLATAALIVAVAAFAIAAGSAWGRARDRYWMFEQVDDLRAHLAQLRENQGPSSDDNYPSDPPPNPLS